MARVGWKKISYGAWLENLTERYHLEDLDLDGRIILKCEISSSCCSDYEDRNSKQDGRMLSGCI